MDANNTSLDRRDFIRTLAIAGVAAGALGLNPAVADAAKCPKFPKRKKSKEIVALHIESEIGDSIDGRIDLRTVETSLTSGAPATLDVELLFDTFEEGTSVREITDKIENLARVDESIHRPPTALLTWGTGASFKGIFESVQTGFSLFLPDGTPCRAVMLVRLELLEECVLGPPDTP